MQGSKPHMPRYSLRMRRIQHWRAHQAMTEMQIWQTARHCCTYSMACCMLYAFHVFVQLEVSRSSSADCFVATFEDYHLSGTLLLSDFIIFLYRSFCKGQASPALGQASPTLQWSGFADLGLSRHLHRQSMLRHRLRHRIWRCVCCIAHCSAANCWD